MTDGWSPIGGHQNENRTRFAGMAGFGFVAALVTLIVRRRHRSIRSAVPDWVALVVAAAVESGRP